MSARNRRNRAVVMRISTVKEKPVRPAAWVLCLITIFLITGCTVGPDFVRPDPPPAERYTHDADPAGTIPADGQSQYFIRGAEVAAEWWRLFEFPAIDQVMREAFVNNQNMKAAQASLRQSQENLRAGYGIFFPFLDAGANVSRQKFSPAHIGSSASSSIFTLYTISGTVSYALDVFGGNRRAVEGLQSEVDFQNSAVLATHLALSGNIVNTMIARGSYYDQITATGEIVDSLKEQVRVADVQAEAGIVSYSKVLNLHSQLAATEATLPLLRQKYSQTGHLLATLVGRTPSEWSPPGVDLSGLKLPSDLPVSLPSDMVRRRPDILAAEAELHRASANIGVATAALFPNFMLNGAYGFNSTSTRDLFDHANSFWNLGADLAAPVFRGGMLWFQRKAAIEAYEQALANYRQTVLEAFAQVADTLRALEYDAEALHAQAQALDAAGQAQQLMKASYDSGIVDYLQLLITNAQYHQARIGYLQARAQRLQDTAALFVALGGGWWNAENNSLSAER